MVAGRTLDLLYADPNLFTDGRPTRSGIPILFPFPNRIRVGRFSWEGKEYQLPLNDSVKQNAIHGFACRRPWRVVGQGFQHAGTAKEVARVRTLVFVAALQGVIQQILYRRFKLSPKKAESEVADICKMLIKGLG